MKKIEVVVAAIIVDHRVFVAQRGYGEWLGYYELPGGKVEEGETKEEALKREMQEELATEVSVDSFIQTIKYDYPSFHLTMHCYQCSIVEGDLTLLEHMDAKWLTSSNIDSVKWLPGNGVLVDKLKEILSN
jgi:8-oxo-dGTP diphosphatase